MQTAVLDYPLVRFSWPGRSAAQTAAAIRFRAWLGSADGRVVLSAIGLRPPGFVSGGALTIDVGARPGAQYVQVPQPEAAEQDQIRTIYRSALRPARVLLALDGSGSMGTLVNGQRRWDVAAKAAADAVSTMGQMDEFGVWVFQGDNAAGVRRLVAPGTPATKVGGQPRAAAVATALNGVRVGGRTPLYDAVVGAVTEVGPTDNDRVTAVVVLTDGEDDNASGLSPERYEAAVAGRHVQVWVVAIGEATCAARALQTLPATTGGQCVEANAASVAPTLTGVLGELWRG
jgi:Mg-chelatase subunit ChlD